MIIPLPLSNSENSDRNSIDNICEVFYNNSDFSAKEENDINDARKLDLLQFVLYCKPNGNSHFLSS